MRLDSLQADSDHGVSTNTSWVMASTVDEFMDSSAISEMRLSPSDETGVLVGQFCPWDFNPH
ncbi:hypothetical protein TanjilG_11073 [Lupinus angustifolius]|uniref:Uncharacterized protein n=1 Tax=Lupinus angustifolius TaxID=3871 RepID=A0A1J7FZA1_LUPAN|nr:hypothetical protein TanjilG_11073 [Lupinus angustifolius]